MFRNSNKQQVRTRTKAKYRYLSSQVHNINAAVVFAHVCQAVDYLVLEQVVVSVWFGSKHVKRRQRVFLRKVYVLVCVPHSSLMRLCVIQPEI